MFYISLDLEWNQAYAQKALAVQKQLGARLRGEVIQIGAVKLDEKMRIVGSYSVIVKPKFFKRMQRHVTALTGISQAQTDEGVPLTEAAENFRNWCGKNYAFMTWGPDDIPMLKDNFHANGIPSDWLSPTYDLQVIFNKQTDGQMSKQRSLEYAMEYYEIRKTLPAHDALNDAYFTALVAAKMDMARGVAQYDERRGKYLEESVIGDADSGEDGFVAISELLEDPSVKEAVCPLCKKKMKQTEKPLHSKGQKYSFLYRCEKDGDMMVSCKLHRNINETWRAKRTVEKANEEMIADYKNKLALGETHKKFRRRRSPKKRSGQAAPAAQQENA